MNWRMKIPDITRSLALTIWGGLMANKKEIFESLSAVNHCEDFRKLTGRYLRNLIEEFDRIKLTAKKGNCAFIKAEAHRIKGTSGTYGLETISENAAQLEHLAEESALERIITKIDEIIQLIKDETEQMEIEDASKISKSKGQTNS